jgi:hypothetical protein
MQFFFASANAEIVAARGDRRYQAQVIRAMQQTLRQELLPLLTQCADGVNAARAVVRGANVWISRK